MSSGVITGDFGCRERLIGIEAFSFQSEPTIYVEFPGHPAPRARKRESLSLAEVVTE